MDEPIKKYFENNQININDIKIEEKTPQNEYILYKFKTNNKFLCKKVSDSYYGYITKFVNEQYTLAVLLPQNGQLIDYEYDRCEDAFELYQSIYGNKITKNKEEYYYHYNKNDNDAKILISGDIDINLKMQKVNFFIDIIEKDSEIGYKEKNNLKNSLLNLHELVYHPNNISIMPVRGGMNNLKAILGFDRVDTFLFTLQQYYNKNNSAYLFNYGRTNMPHIELIMNLKDYLDSFNGIYEYCKEIYHISDKNFIDELCEFGKKAILTTTDIENYKNLSLNFWMKKSIFFENADKKIKQIYDLMVNKQKEIRGLKHIYT